MKMFDLLPYLIFLPVFFRVAQFLLSRSEFYQNAVQASSHAKYQTLDGLRGLLALGVFFTHAACNYHVLKDGLWESYFYKFLGDAAVWCFFMMTGFLFWSKAIASPRLDLKKFYTNRCLRIFPSYWFLVLVTFGIAIVQFGFSFPNSPLETLIAIVQWLTCQVIPFPIIHGVETLPNVVGSETWMINGGIAWTLAYELNFYLFFPVLAYLATPARFALLCLGVLAISRVVSDMPTTEILAFFCGMAGAHGFKHFRWENFLSHPAFSGVAIVALWFGGARYLPDKVSVLLIGAAFMIFVYGNSLFGLLTSRALRYLGIISFDFYLFHGVVIYVIFRVVQPLISFQTISPWMFWGLSGLCGILSIWISGLTYQYIAHPFLQKKSSDQLSMKRQVS